VPNETMERGVGYPMESALISRNTYCAKNNLTLII